MGHALDTLPKVDLCCHFEGALPLQLLSDLARKHGRPNAETPLGPLPVSDAVGLANARAQVRNLLVTTEDFFAAGQALGEALLEQAVVHVDLHVDPTLWPASHPKPAELLEAIDAGLHAARPEGDEALLSWSLLVELRRELAGDTAEALIDALLRAEVPHLGGVAIAVESAPGQTALHLDRALALAKEAGLARVVATDRGKGLLAEALQLGAQRIVGGAAALEDADLLLQLRAHRVPIAICPSAQVLAGLARSVAELRLRRMMDAGLFVAFGSGWPVLLGASVGAEFEAVTRHHHWKLDDVRNATARAIEAVATEATRRFQLARTVEIWRHRPMAGPGKKGDDWSL